MKNINFVVRIVGINIGFLLMLTVMISISACKREQDCCMVIDPVDTTTVTLPCKLPVTTFSTKLNDVGYHPASLLSEGDATILGLVSKTFPTSQHEYEIIVVTPPILGRNQLHNARFDVNQQKQAYALGVLKKWDLTLGEYTLDTTYNNYIDLHCIDTVTRTYGGEYEMKMVYSNMGQTHWVPFADTLLWKGKFHLGY